MATIFINRDGDTHWVWKALILILGTVIFGVILSTVLTAAFTIFFAGQGLPQAQALEKAGLIVGNFEPQVILSVLQLIFMLWLVRWLVTRVEKQSFSWPALGLNSGSDRSKLLISGALIALVITMLTVGAGLIVGSLEYTGIGFDLFSDWQVIKTLILGAVLALASGLGEEFAFRGYLQARLAKYCHPAIAILVVATLFALSHPWGNVSNPVLYLASAILVGVLFGVLFIRSGSLWMGIALHAVWNYLQIAVVAVRNGADERFFGAALLIFDSQVVTSQLLVEFCVIFAAILVILLFRKVRTQRTS